MFSPLYLSDWHQNHNQIKIEFNYKEISGLSSNIYVPSVSSDKTLEIAKILKTLPWKVGETPLEIKVIKYKQTF